MENGPFIDGLPIKISIYKGFSMAMLNNQRVYIYINYIPSIFPHWSKPPFFGSGWTAKPSAELISCNAAISACEKCGVWHLGRLGESSTKGYYGQLGGYAYNNIQYIYIITIYTHIYIYTHHLTILPLPLKSIKYSTFHVFLFMSRG